MKKYEEPVVEILQFHTEDIITTSDVEDGLDFGATTNLSVDNLQKIEVNLR